MSNEKPRNDKKEQHESGASTQNLKPVRVDDQRATAKAKVKAAYDKEKGNK